MKEKLQEYALIAEIIGGIAIVLSLIFVGVQIQQSSNAAKAQTRTTLTQIAHEMIATQMTPEWADIDKAISEGKGLTDEQQRTFVINTIMQLRTAENVFYQHRVGTFDDEEFSGYRNFYKRMFSNPFVQEIWGNRRDDFSVVLQEEIDHLILEIKYDTQ